MGVQQSTRNRIPASTRRRALAEADAEAALFFILFPSWLTAALLARSRQIIEQASSLLANIVVL